MDKTDHVKMRAEDDETPELVRAEYDWDAVPPSVAVTEAVGRAAGQDPADVGPLIAYFDPDALDTLLQSDDEANRSANTTVTFEMGEYGVRISSDGVVAVYGGSPVS